MPNKWIFRRKISYFYFLGQNKMARIKSFAHGYEIGKKFKRIFLFSIFSTKFTKI